MTTKSELPETMKAAVVDAAGPPKAIHIKDVPVPKLSRNHVIIALEYAGLGSWDAAQRSGAWGPVKPGTILGADGSGTIAAVAADVTNFKVGDRVYSYSYSNPSGGFHAEYVSVPADRVGHIPPHLDMKVAGAMPCVALTAQSGLESAEDKKVADSIGVWRQRRCGFVRRLVGQRTRRNRRWLSTARCAGIRSLPGSSPCGRSKFLRAQRHAEAVRAAKVSTLPWSPPTVTRLLFSYLT